MSTQVTLLCDLGQDLDQGGAGQNITTHFLRWDDREFEIDLCEHHETTATLAEIIQHARPVVTGRARGARELDLSDVRKWAKDRGLKVGDFGAISADVIQAYVDAH
jgi:hypothetical protein